MYQTCVMFKNMLDICRYICIWDVETTPFLIMSYLLTTRIFITASLGFEKHLSARVSSTLNFHKWYTTRNKYAVPLPLPSPHVMYSNKRVFLRHPALVRGRCGPCRCHVVRIVSAESVGKIVDPTKPLFGEKKWGKSLFFYLLGMDPVGPACFFFAWHNFTVLCLTGCASTLLGGKMGKVIVMLFCREGHYVHTAVSWGCATCRINKPWKQLQQARKKRLAWATRFDQMRKSSSAVKSFPSCNQVSSGSFWFAFYFSFASQGEQFADLQVETYWGGTLE